MGSGDKICLVRWPVFEGVDREGVTLEPESRPVARMVAAPDADWARETMLGMTPGVDACGRPENFLHTKTFS